MYGFISMKGVSIYYAVFLKAEYPLPVCWCMVSITQEAEAGGFHF